MYSRRSIFDKNGSLSIPPDYSGTSMRQRTYLGRSTSGSASHRDTPVKSAPLPPPEYRRLWDPYPMIPSGHKEDNGEGPGFAPFGEGRDLSPETPSPYLKAGAHKDGTAETASEAAPTATEAPLHGSVEFKTDDMLLAALLILMLADADKNKETILILAVIFLSSGVI